MRSSWLTRCRDRGFDCTWRTANESKKGSSCDQCVVSKRSCVFGGSSKRTSEALGSDDEELERTPKRRKTERRAERKVEKRVEKKVGKKVEKVVEMDETQFEDLTQAVRMLLREVKHMADDSRRGFARVGAGLEALVVEKKLDRFYEHGGSCGAFDHTRETSVEAASTSGGSESEWSGAEDVDLSTLGTRGLNAHLYLLGGAQHYFPSVVAGLRANREAAGNGETRVEEQVVEVEKIVGAEDAEMVVEDAGAGEKE